MIGQLVADGQSDPAAALFGGLARAKENQMSWESGALIGDGECGDPVVAASGERDRLVGGGGLQGVCDEVDEDEKDEVGHVIGPDRFGGGSGLEADLGYSSTFGGLADHQLDEFLGGDFVLGSGVFFAEDVHDLIDHGLHAPGGGDRVFDIGGGLGGIGIAEGAHESLEAGEGIFEAVDEVGGHGADGGGFGGEGEFLVGLEQVLGSFGEELVCPAEFAKRPGDGQAEDETADGEAG